MELRQLKYFVKTAELLSITEASKQLNITQSTLSQQISQLEAELDAVLFFRSHNKIALTELGQTFLPSAKRTLNEANASILKLHDVQNLNTGEITIGTTYTFLPLLQDTVLEFIKIYPGIKVTIICKSMEELLEMLKTQDIDIALSYKPQDIDSQIESHILFGNKLCVVANKRNAISKYKRLTIKELEKFNFCLPVKGNQARNCLENILNYAPEIKLNVKVEINDINILLNLVEKSNLVTFVSQATIINRAHLVGIPLELPNCDMQGSFHILKNTYMKFAIKKFLRLLCDNRSISDAMLDML